LAIGPPVLAPFIWGWLEMRRIAAMSREADHIILSGDDQGKLPPMSEQEFKALVEEKFKSSQTFPLYYPPDPNPL
jgi:hypothetical protein